MRYLKKGTNIGKIEAKGNSRIKIQCEMWQSGMNKEKISVYRKSGTFINGFLFLSV